MYKGYLEKCMPSEMMRNYLKDQELSPWRIVDLIMYSPVSVEIKLEELRKVREDAVARGDSELIEECDKGIKYIGTALGYLETDGVYSVEVCEYDSENIVSDSSFERVCATIEDVREFIKEDLKISEAKPEDPRWYDITKWIKNPDGKYIAACDYVIARDDVIFIDIRQEERVMECDATYEYWFGADLNLPVPFKAGDLLEFDGFPFGPKCHVLILDIGDNNDCCCVQGLAINEEGKWRCGAVKHGMISYDYFPKNSYLYSARIFEGELPENERVLLEIKDYIGGDAARGKEVYEKVWADSMTEEELVEKTGIGKEHL